MKRQAVFVDKDGTLIENVPYNVDPERVALNEGAGEAIAELTNRGWLIVVVSNQPGIALGKFDAAALAAVESRIQQLLAPYGASIDAFYYCPHAPDGPGPACGCRKPQPGMLHSAARDLGIDLERSWLVGDILDDVEAGNRAGCRTILFSNGNETEWRMGPRRRPACLVRSLPAAAEVVVSAFDASLYDRGNNAAELDVATRA